MRASVRISGRGRFSSGSSVRVRVEQGGREGGRGRNEKMAKVYHMSFTSTRTLLGVGTRCECERATWEEGRENEKIAK